MDIARNTLSEGKYEIVTTRTLTVKQIKSGAQPNVYFVFLLIGDDVHVKEVERAAYAIPGIIH